MKIGIITLSASYNCGSMLQSYALKEILKKYGDVEIINFSSIASHRIYDLIPHSPIKKLKIFLKRRELLKELKHEISAYTSFQRNYLGINGKEYFTNELNRITNKYDVVVAGSDQVWNVDMEDFDEAFLCNWTQSKKIAYAPSLGGHDIRESKKSQQYISYIKDFDFISVRETVGKQCLDEILNDDVTKVLDPTLVYDTEKWREMAGPSTIKGEYIFFYSWAYYYDDLRDIVKKRAKELNLPVYVIDAHKWKDHSYKEDGFILCNEAGPLAFLNLMANAKECYVESFHGMLFAYMFKRNFWLLDTHENYNELDARLKELVEFVNAKDRIVTRFNYDKTDFHSVINYSENKYLDQMKTISMDFLSGAFNK